MARAPVFLRLHLWLAAPILLLGADLAAEAYLVGRGPAESAAGAVALFRMLGIPLLAAVVLALVPLLLLALGMAAAMQREWAVVRRCAEHALALVSGCFIVVAADRARPEGRLRLRAMSGAAERAAPLVAAIQRYEREHGSPPATLGDVDPRYAEAPPELGIRSCRPLRYQARGASAFPRWELYAECPRGFMDLDRMRYDPSGSYWHLPSHSRVGAWAYVWD